MGNDLLESWRDYFRWAMNQAGYGSPGGAARLADKTGIVHSSISKYANGRQIPDAERIPVLAEALGRDEIEMLVMAGKTSVAALVRFLDIAADDGTIDPAELERHPKLATLVTAQGSDFRVLPAGEQWPAYLTRIREVVENDPDPETRALKRALIDLVAAGFQAKAGEATRQAG